ncbi:putative FYVE zinc finger, Zinc finger, FYVE/PHD-type, Zinc finger, RING/FYVE/PHD-type [Plasmopara halstedii]
MAKTLPLPPHFFQCPDLTEREVQYLIGKAKESAKSLVDATRNNEGPVRWEEAGMHRGVQLYKGEARYPESVVGESITYGCGATTIQSTLDEVADFFDVSTDAKLADFVESFSDILDAQLLYVLEDPALLNDPRYNARTQRNGCSKMLNANQVTVSWFAIDIPSKLLKNRDFLTVECQSTFLDVSGRRGWVRSYHSIKLPCCPELSDYSLVRGSFYHTGYVFVESERPGFLDVIFSAQVNLKGSLKVPAPLYATIQKKRLTSIAQLQKLITRRRLGAQRFLGDLELVPKSQRTHCNLCSSKFGLINRKSRCRKCGEVVCASSCSTEWEVSISGQGVRKVRVCSKCAQNTDPSAFEGLTPSEQYSETNSGQDEDAPYANVHAPGYQYERYNRSESGSSPTSRSGRHGQPSLDSEDSDSQRRRLQASGRRGHNESLSPRGDSFYESELEYPRTMEMPGNDSMESDRYLLDGNESEEYMQSSDKRRDDRRYDPRNPDVYDHEMFGRSPPPYRDDEQRRALQRQQRALQQHQNKQRLLQRQQHHQDELRRRRQYQNDDSEQYRDGIEPFASSQSSGTSSGAPSFLTSSLLAQHTKDSGKPGPVTRTERAATIQERTKRRGPDPREPERRLAAPAMPSDRPLTRLEQIQVKLWEEQEARFRDQVDMGPSYDFELDLEPEVPTKSTRYQRTGSIDGLTRRRGPKLPAFFRSAESQGHGTPTGESPSVKPPPFPKVQGTYSGQTVSVADDEDRLDFVGPRDDSISRLSRTFGALLRPEDLRPTEKSVRFSDDSTGQDEGGTSDYEKSFDEQEDAGTWMDVSESTVVKLYERILKLTNKQHELESQPESDPKEKEEVARELENLYDELHAAEEMK